MTYAILSFIKMPLMRLFHHRYHDGKVKYIYLKFFRYYISVKCLPRTPTKPSVAWRSALLSIARLLLDFLLPAVPTVDACREATSW